MPQISTATWLSGNVLLWRSVALTTSLQSYKRPSASWHLRTRAATSKISALNIFGQTPRRISRAQVFLAPGRKEFWRIWGCISNVRHVRQFTGSDRTGLMRAV
ncbi:hypothetical protein DFP72DRAFT_891223 [Ephemerocybe angulata]|uniref:Secreted protein n=1 Tax=Ephemerocybe angulata TaxID=980116 RepID=A0A8H6I3X6_9AGAR|nr:hypothetical protein DFP72DRAFT_891223 [Tulosesus angulatus]